ncbi:PAS domain S-box-containing protein [Maribacter vaceletii]|uniref:histidine kinase n=1 Tax=Maribacter vaceletii TaxID=1206816 RepID=A0A495EH77_9FLAO|nr:PAS domain-containing protein [Maribacter vaceletii]RKR15327.1 PAS domain S-box-containing protein [Maribacter vaceletii]
MIQTKSNISNWLGNLDGGATIDEFFFDGLWGINLAVSEDFWFSQKFWNTLEYTSEEVFTTKKTLHSILHKEDIEYFISACNNIKNNSNALNCTVRFYAKSGIIWMKLRGKIINQEEGNCKIVGSAISVSDIKEKTQILERKVQYYKNVIGGGKVAIWELNFNTGLVEINERYSEIIGYSVSELQPLTKGFWVNLVHPDDKSLIDKTYFSVLEDKGSFEIEFRLKHKKGHWVWVLSSGKLTDINQDGSGKLASGFLYDITSKKKGELLLLDYSNIIKRINHVAKIGIWEVNINYNKILESSISIDESFKKLTEIPKDFHPTLSKAINLIKGKENKKEHKAVIERAIKYGEDYDVIYPIVTRVTKKTKWVRVIGISEYENGKCNRLFGFLLDVDKETRLSQTLAFKEEEIRQTFDQAAIGMGVVDLENNLKEANNSLVNIFEYTKEEAYKVPYENIIHPEDYNITMPLIQEVIQGRRNFFSREVRGVTKFGKEIWVFMNLSAIKNDKGELIHLLIQMLDVTEKKETEIKLADYSNLMKRINTAAKIGIWELNLENNEVYWDTNIKKMLGVPADYTATLEDDISYFKEGYSRDTIALAVKNALENGAGFDVFLEVFSKSRNKYIWTRTTGIVEFTNGVCTRLYGFFQDVDKETRVSKELALKEKELRHNFDQSAMGMAFINLEGKPERVNKALLNITGFSEKDFYNKFSFGSLAHPKDKEKAKLMFKRVSSGALNSVQEEIRCVHKKGHIIWLNIIASSIKNDEGEIIHFFTQNQDITEKKETALKLADFSNLMSRINITAKIGIWEIDLKTHEIFWDDTIKKILGVPLNYMASIQKDINFYKEGYSRETFREVLNNAMNIGKGFNVVLEAKNVSRNEYLWTRTTGIVEFKNGSCNRLYGFFQDVDTETKNSKELSIKEEELRNTFNQAYIGMAFIGPDSKVLKVNTSLIKIFGYSKEEMYNFSYGALAHPEDKSKTKLLLDEILLKKQDAVKGEIRAIHKKGHIVWVTIVISAVKNDRGELLHMLLQIQDVTKTKSLTENLKEHNNRLVNFAHIVSHNLRSHASNISMLLDLTSKDYPKLMENDFLKNIKIVSDNMNDTIYDLNKIVEIKSNISASLSSYKLIDFVNKSIQNINSLIKEANAKIVIDVPKDVSVLAIQAYLESIVLNLITNAVKYRMPDRRLKIYINAKIEWDNVIFSIEDNGLGINLNKHGDKLFGLYKVFHAHKDAKGIGLFLVKNQLEAMGGKIKVESKEHIGTKFTTYFKIG